MLQTIEATISPLGHVTLDEKVRLDRSHRAIVTILDHEPEQKNGEQEWSLFGSVEIIDEDLESASREISEMLNESISRSERDVNGQK